MASKVYPLQMEIAGNTAIWTRPDTGDSPCSYPAPTYSAVKALFESVLWGPDVLVEPVKAERSAAEGQIRQRWEQLSALCDGSDRCLLPALCPGAAKSPKRENATDGFGMGPPHDFAWPCLSGDFQPETNAGTILCQSVIGVAGIYAVLLRSIPRRNQGMFRDS